MRHDRKLDLDWIAKVEGKQWQFFVQRCQAGRNMVGPSWMQTRERGQLGYMRGSRRISKRCSPTVVTLLSAPEVALRLAVVRHHRHHRSVTSLTGTSTRLKERKGAWQQE